VVERRSSILREDDIQSVLGYFVAENFSEVLMKDRPFSLGFEALQSFLFT
jgi:hypothetical protein